MLTNWHSATAWLLVVVCLTAPRPAGAAPPKRHNIPVLSVRSLHLGSITLSAPDQPRDLRLRTHVLRVKGMFGGRINSSGTILAGELTYDWIGLDHASTADDYRRHELHSLFARLAWMQKLSGPWGFVVFARLGLSSDMAGIGWRDLRASTGAAVTYRWNKNINISIGYTYSNQFFGELVLPLITARGTHGPWWFQLVIPRGGQLWYALRPSLEVGLKLEALSLRHTLYRPEPSLTDEYGHLTVSLGAGLRAYLYKGIFVAVEGGYAVRYYRLSRGGSVAYETLNWIGGYGGISTGYMY